MRRTAVRFKGLGGAIAAGGPPDLRAVRRDGAAWASEKPFACIDYYGSGGVGARGRGSVGSVRAWIPPLDPRNCYRRHVPYHVRCGRCVDKRANRRAALRPSATVLVLRAPNDSALALPAGGIAETRSRRTDAYQRCCFGAVEFWVLELGFEMHAAAERDSLGGCRRSRLRGNAHGEPE